MSARHQAQRLTCCTPLHRATWRPCTMPAAHGPQRRTTSSHMHRIHMPTGLATSPRDQLWNATSGMAIISCRSASSWVLSRPSVPLSSILIWTSCVRLWALCSITMQLRAQRRRRLPRIMPNAWVSHSVPARPILEMCWINLHLIRRRKPVLTIHLNWKLVPCWISAVVPHPNQTPSLPWHSTIHWRTPPTNIYESQSRVTSTLSLIHQVRQP